MTLHNWPTSFDSKLGSHHKQKLAAHFSAAAASYDDSATLQQRVLQRLAAVLPSVEAGKRVLDAGCGTGKLAHYWPHAPLIGIDIAPAMCQHTALQGHYVQVIQADMEQLPFTETAFAGITSSLALQWLNSPATFFTQAATMVTAGGWLAIATLTSGTLAPLAQAYQQCGLRSTLLPFMDSHHVSDHIRNAGWVVETSEHFTEETHHSDIYSLLKSMKEIGANHSAQTPSIRHRGDLAQLETAYRTITHNTEEGQPLTAPWETLIIIARRS